MGNNKMCERKYKLETTKDTISSARLPLSKLSKNSDAKLSLYVRRGPSLEALLLNLCNCKVASHNLMQTFNENAK